MSPSTPKPTAKRVAYKPRRDRREVGTAIVVFALILVVTVSLVWFLRPNRDTASTPTSDTSSATSTTTPTDTTATTAPGAATDTTTETTAPAASGG